MNHRLVFLILVTVTFYLPACLSENEDCRQDRDCDDGDMCTENRCRLGRCSALRLPSCCYSHADCTADGRRRCDLDSQTCVGCLSDGDCPLETSCDLGRHQCIGSADRVGEACTANDDCGGGTCLPENQTAMPGGFCAQECTEATDCASFACIQAPGGSMTCLPPCASDADCRPAYLCLALDATHGACFPHCTETAHCPSTGVCNPWLGVCFGEIPGQQNGAPCASDDDCKGFCLEENESRAPGGVCISLCSPGKTQCPVANEACLVTVSPFLNGLTACLPVHDRAQACRDQFAPLVALELATEQPVPVCQPACRADGCSTGTCNEYSGLCNDPPGPGPNGAPCQDHPDCQGLCLGFWTGGFCTSPCNLAGPACPDGGPCMDLGVQTSCGVSCADDGDCREAEGYLCNPAKICLPE